jgi:hypothetical protein
MAPAEGAREDALQARAGGGGLAAPLALARTLLGVLYRRRAGCEQAHTCQPVGRYGSLRGARLGWNRNSLFLGRITCSRPIACAAIALGSMLQCMMAPSAHLCAAENHRARGAICWLCRARRLASNCGERAREDVASLGGPRWN